MFSGHLDHWGRFFFRHKKADGRFEYADAVLLPTDVKQNLTFIIRYSRLMDGVFVAYLAGKEIARWSGPTVNPNGGNPYHPIQTLMGASPHRHHARQQ